MDSSQMRETAEDMSAAIKQEGDGLQALNKPFPRPSAPPCEVPMQSLNNLFSALPDIFVQRRPRGRNKAVGDLKGTKTKPGRGHVYAHRGLRGSRGVQMVPAERTTTVSKGLVRLNASRAHAAPGSACNGPSRGGVQHALHVPERCETGSPD